jgi:hypothetical protein
LKIDSTLFETEGNSSVTNGGEYLISNYLCNYEHGLKSYKSLRKEVRAELDGFIREDGMVDAAMLETAWFPNLKCDVFLSHSHADENLAIAFANWLAQNFGIRTFIDSTVWGYALDLQKELDDRYNLRLDGYDYKGSNRVCGFVDMLLATSLSKMIDRCECLMFLDTGNSIIPTNKSNQETSSPWIYHELLQSRIIEKKLTRPATKLFSQAGRLVEAVAESKQLKFKPALPADTEHLWELNASDLKRWSNAHKNGNFTKTADISLDILYTLTADNQKKF